jgi:hypothetical protein
MIPDLKTINENILLTMVLAVYKSDCGNHHIEYHPVIQNKIKAARMFSYDLIKDVLENYKVIKKINPSKKPVVSINGQVPNNLFYFNVNKQDVKMIFYDASKIRKIFFTKDCNKLETKKYKVPGIVFFYENKALHVFAYKKWNGSKTLLYHLGLPNINDAGEVCMGNVKRAELSDANDIINETLESFWNSYFREWRTTRLIEAEDMWKNNNYEFKEHFLIGTLKNIANETLSAGRLIT